VFTPRGAVLGGAVAPDEEDLPRRVAGIDEDVRDEAVARADGEGGGRAAERELPRAGGRGDVERLRTGGRLGGDETAAAARRRAARQGVVDPHLVERGARGRRRRLHAASRRDRQ